MVMTRCVRWRKHIPLDLYNHTLRHMSGIASKIPGKSQLSIQQLVQTNSKEKSKDPYYLPFGKESTGDQWIPFTGVFNLKNVSIAWRLHEFSLLPSDFGNRI